VWLLTQLLPQPEAVVTTADASEHDSFWGLVAVQNVESLKKLAELLRGGLE